MRWNRGGLEFIFLKRFLGILTIPKELFSTVNLVKMPLIESERNNIAISVEN
jgi:hypothetical protein